MPGLRKEVVSGTMPASLDSGKDPKIAQDGLLKLENAAFRRAGAISKRYGYVEATSDVHDAQFLASFQDRPVLFGEELRGWESLGDDIDDGAWVERASYLLLLDAESKPLAAGAEVQVFNVDLVVIDSDVLLLAWNEVALGETFPDGYSTKAATFTADTGVPIASLTLDNGNNATARNARIVLDDTTAYIYWLDSGTDTPEYVTVDNAGAFGTPTSVGSGPLASSTKAGIDACLIQAGSHGIAYVNSTEDCVAVVVESGAAAHIRPISATTVSGVWCWRMGTTRWVVCFNDIGVSPQDVDCISLDVDTNIVHAQQTVYASTDDYIRSAAGVSTAGDQTSFWLDVGETANEFEEHCLFRGTFGAAFGAATRVCRGISLESYPFEIDTNEFVWAQYSGHPVSDQSYSPQRTMFLVDKNGLPWAKWYVGIAGRPWASDVRGWKAPQMQELATGEWSTGAITASGSPVGVSVNSKFFGSSNPMAQLKCKEITEKAGAVDVGDYLMIASSLGFETNLNDLVEQGFLIFPEGIPTPTAAGTGGSLSAGRSYAYKATYERVDAFGGLHESAPSRATESVVPTGTQKITVYVPMLHLTHADDVRVVLWRTIGDGSIFYRVGEVNNDRSEEYAEFVDGDDDDDLSQRKALYTEGGAIFHIQPPPWNIEAAATVWQNRLFLVDAEREDYLIRYSREFDKGLGVEHNDFLTIKVSRDGGPIRALKNLDDKLLIFKDARVFATHGAPLNDLASGVGFADPYTVSHELGCVNHKSIVRTTQGVFFLSANGIYLVDRSLQVMPIGEPALYYTQDAGLGALIVAALNVPQDSTVIWFTSDSDGRALVYNYKYGLWSIHTNHQASGACLAQDAYWFRVHGASTQKVVAQDRTVFTDDDTGIATKLETGWFSFAGLQGFSRARSIHIMGHNVNPHILRAKTAYNYVPEWVDDQEVETANLKTFDVDDHYGDGLSQYTGEEFLVKLRTSRQKVSSVRLSLDDGESADGLAHIVESSTIALWQMNESVAGDDIVDAGPNGHDGAAQRGDEDVGTGKFDGARNPNTGVTGGWFVPHDAALQPTVFTIAGWIKVISDAKWGSLFEQRTQGGRGHCVELTIGWGTSTRNFNFMVQRSDYSYARATATTTSTDVVGVWTHIGATWDGTTARIYINGVEEANDDNAGDPDYETYPICIGRSHGGTTDDFPAWIDNLAFYGEVKDAAWFAAFAGAGVETFDLTGLGFEIARKGGLIRVGNKHQPGG